MVLQNQSYLHLKTNYNPIRVLKGLTSGWHLHL